MQDQQDGQKKQRQCKIDQRPRQRNQQFLDGFFGQAIQYGHAAATYLAPRLASDDLRFEDWGPHLRQSRLGFDLGVRTRIVGLCFGPRRPAMERYLLRTPSLLDAALRGWGGHQIPWTTFARLGMATAALAARLPLE